MLSKWSMCLRHMIEWNVTYLATPHILHFTTGLSIKLNFLFLVISRSIHACPAFSTPANLVPRFPVPRFQRPLYDYRPTCMSSMTEAWRRHQLHWLNTAERIQFWIAVTVHRCLNGLVPAYLTQQCVIVTLNWTDQAIVCDRHIV